MLLSALGVLSTLGVGRIRARYLTARLPNPPVRPVRETFASYGSRERDIMGSVHFASSTEHSPWTALRVRWVPLYCFPTLSLRAFAMCAVFPHADYYALFDCLQGLGAFGTGLPYLLPTLLLIPCRLSRVQHGGLKQDDGGGVLLDVHFISSLPVILRSACKAWVDRGPVQIVAAED